MKRDIIQRVGLSDCCLQKRKKDTSVELRKSSSYRADFKIDKELIFIINILKELFKMRSMKNRRLKLENKTDLSSLKFT